MSFEDDLKNTIKKMANSFDEETVQKSQEELEDYWFFEWKDSRTPESNFYEFHKALNLYQNRCRKWEETHNGICCVVERVRDTYLLPKIREFNKLLKEKL